MTEKETGQSIVVARLLLLLVFLLLKKSQYSIELELRCFDEPREGLSLIGKVAFGGKKVQRGKAGRSHDDGNAKGDKFLGDSGEGIKKIGARLVCQRLSRFHFGFLVDDELMANFVVDVRGHSKQNLRKARNVVEENCADVSVASPVEDFRGVLFEHCDIIDEGNQTGKLLIDKGSSRALQCTHKVFVWSTRSCERRTNSKRQKKGKRERGKENVEEKALTFVFEFLGKFEMSTNPKGNEIVNSFVETGP